VVEDRQDIVLGPRISGIVLSTLSVPESPACQVPANGLGQPQKRPFAKRFEGFQGLTAIRTEMRVPYDVQLEDHEDVLACSYVDTYQVALGHPE
jgi:hypothetical protein